jgi:AcrR family transcriptional regulator
MSGTNTRPRGRPRLFDEDAVLEELTELFWRKGYSQTSMADLVDVSGVHKSSLYSTFGTKDELFATIMRRYLDAQMNMFSDLIVRAGPGFDGIHAFLDLLPSTVASGNGQHGCLLINTSAELGGSAPGFEDFAVAQRKEMWNRMRVLISHAERPNTTDQRLTDQRTDVFVTFMMGYAITTRGGADQAELERIVDSMHATVETWRP